MGFWDKALGTGPTPQPPYNPNLPRRPEQQHLQQPQFQPQAPPPGYQQPQPYQNPPQYQAPVQGAPDPAYADFVPNTVDPSKMSEVLPIWGWHGNQKYDHQGNPMGGAAESQASGNCPHCGSVQYFSRHNGESPGSSAGVTTANGVVYPAPECFECGYPRIQGNLAAPPGQQGPVTVVGTGAARQGARPAMPPGSLRLAPGIH